MESFLLEPILIVVAAILIYTYVLAAISARSRREARTGSSDGLFFAILVPALNEEAVIARTLSRLLTLSGDFLVLVIDDGSDDGTVAAVRAFVSDPRVRLLERTGHQARLGKAAALNAGHAEIQRLGLGARYGAENVIVVVFDADTLVPPEFLQAVAPYFRDANVAGVQSAVRMYNDSQNVLTCLQHFEFVAWNEIFCRAKDVLGSATLGGNGQCVRLSALASLAEGPWLSTLTEDLDLSLRLMLKNLAVRFCPLVAVQQEAPAHLSRLVRQRSRWVQGHLASWRYIPGLVRTRLPLRTRIDVTIFLLLPALFLPVGLASIGSWIEFWLAPQWSPSRLAGLYLIGFGMAPLAVYALRRAERLGLLQTLIFAHWLTLYTWVWFFAFLIAQWHILLGRRAWLKTSRTAGTWTVVGTEQGS